MRARQRSSSFWSFTLQYDDEPDAEPIYILLAEVSRAAAGKGSSHTLSLCGCSCQMRARAHACAKPSQYK